MSIFGYPMDSWVHTGTLVFLSLRAREYTGGDLREIALKYRVWSQYWEAECHSEFPRPNGWCLFSGTLWTHESTQVLWCSWVLGQGSTEGQSSWNSVTKSGLITILGKLNAIVNCRVPMADVIFGYPMHSWVHTGTLVILSLRARQYTGGDLREIALKDRVWSQYWASWTP